MKKENRLLISKNGENIALVRDCRTAWEIGIGLIGTKESAHNENKLYEGVLLRIPVWRQKFSGLVNSIHMIGMKYPISVFWISGSRIVDKVLGVPGCHIYSPSHPASAVLELPEAAFNELIVGDSLTVAGTDYSIISKAE